MYNNPTTPMLASTGIGTAATSGTTFFWVFLGAFALIAAGSAMMRIVPRRRKKLLDS